MASLPTLTKPISETSFFLPKLSNLEFLRSKIRPLTRSNVFKNSTFSSGGQYGPTFDVPLLSCSEVIERMRTSREGHKTKQLYLAMYSSVFGGITTDTAAMVIPMDDHMVHRGHGVFDTAAIMDGYLYELDQHLDRFLGSATMAKIQIPFDRESIRGILIRTVSVSKCRKGSLRYWLSAGPGDFQLSSSGCHQATLYAIVIKDQSPPDHRGIRVVTSSIPIKPPQFAVMKSVNYLPNALSKMEAEENDAYAAIWLDDDGFVAEGPNMNVAFVTKEKDLLMPCFDKILSGCTAKRVAVLAENLVKEGKLRGIRVENVSVEDAKRADEMMLIGSGVLVHSVVQWDEEVIGNGREGPVTQALLNLLLDGRAVHEHFLRSRFSHYTVPNNTLINMYAKCESMGDARKVFDEMPERDMVSWTALITGYSQNEDAKEGLVLFTEMLRFGFMPNQFTFGSVLKAAGALENGSTGRQLHGGCVKCGYEENVYVGSALVDMYTRCGLMDEGKIVFDKLSCKNEVSWNGLIAGHARKGEGEIALKLFCEMKRGGFQPTHFTFSSVYAACANIGALEPGKWVHVHMIKSGLELIAFIGNTLLDMYAKSGSIDDARRVFDRLLKKDVVSWNSMLTAYAQHGLGKETVECFEEMCRIGPEPNEVTFLCALTACSHAGLLDNGMHYFELMKKFKIEPNISHYVTIVDLLGRSGQLDRAEKFINEMPIEPTAAVWKALLGACRMHKNLELGVYAAERVFELDPHDSGPHILLSNIYASAGRRSDAARVRKMMNQSGVKKEPACSWVEIENAVHMFVANDDAHPQREEIRNMWENITDKIKEIGYVPDTSHVLWFMDQQEREERLQYHSERLALAFALLNSPPGSPIRIKKNIRVCGDCHTAFKFVSKVVDREIILRDTNRFHHFLNGSCSCGDYW